MGYSPRGREESDTTERLHSLTHSLDALFHPPPGDLPNPGIEPLSTALAGGFFTTEPPLEIGVN